MKDTVRCPYCVSDLAFRPMFARVDSSYICSKCGHTAQPKDVNYECHCSNCRKLGARASVAS